MQVRASMDLFFAYLALKYFRRICILCQGAMFIECNLMKPSELEMFCWHPGHQCGQCCSSLPLQFFFAAVCTLRIPKVFCCLLFVRYQSDSDLWMNQDSSANLRLFCRIRCF